MAKLKVKQYGKNIKTFKILCSLEGTKITDKNGNDCKKLFEKLIGYEYLCKPCKCGFEATGCDGETFKVETTQMLEFC